MRSSTVLLARYLGILLVCTVCLTPMFLYVPAAAAAAAPTALESLSLAPDRPAEPSVDTQPIPVMAYYYIWFDGGKSWTNNKRDWPMLGRYNSDDRKTMEQHVRWAKEAGIDGFIVSWKSTYQLDKRLAQLVEVAAEADFPLWIIYQGLDYERDPLPVEHIAADLERFIATYSQNPVFTRDGLPVVIWSGTWEFTPEDIASVASRVKGKLTLLASERNLAGYKRLARVVDGNAYYWSSVNPDTFPGYDEKLADMGAEVHKNGGLWVAPAAPGFDARMLGGERVVERNNGDTLRRELAAALQSAPDAVGLISWNEFSENSHVEPSLNYGTESLSVIADLQHGQPPAMLDFDSSAPATTNHNDMTGITVVAAFGVFFVISVMALIKRSSVKPA